MLQASFAGVSAGGISPSVGLSWRDRVRAAVRDPERRKFFGVYLGAKMLGIVALFGAIALLTWLASGVASAMPLVKGQAAAPNVTDVVNATNTAWTLVAAFLVFFMQAGFMMLEAGFARTRETVNILLECVADTALCGLLFWAFGFAFMFGTGNGLIGHTNFFLNGAGATATYGSTGVAFLAFFLFQFAFADTCSTITSGAMVGRTDFKGDLLYSVGVSGFIYPILGHWIWGPGGWLGSTMGWFHGWFKGGVVFHDFAGSTVVHTIGGVLALTGAIALGPRLGRVFKRDGGGLMPGHDLTIAALGGVILWFGWYGFNPGSTLSALDSAGIGRVAANTTLAACSGALVAMAWMYKRVKFWDLGITTNGFLAGLVAITCPCYWVSPTGAVLIGAIAALVCIWGIDFIEWLRIDDPIGAVAVHGGAGIWGTLSLGLFASGQYGVPTPNGADTSTVVKGLFYGGGLQQLGAQVLGSVVITACTLAGGLALMFGVRAIKMLRVSEQGELQGLDLHEHGSPAYRPEFQFTGYVPAGSSHPQGQASAPSGFASGLPAPVEMVPVEVEGGETSRQAEPV
ncbi:MAG TPA: ammonium transporter [Acidimicrobiales bacterium]|jgi:Amt family ammonium transporter|nr:ammonium transporter [Acidimicrobiales bacterium]